MPDEEVKRTSIDLPLGLWRRVKVRAIAENRTARDLLVEALELYLATKAKKGGR